MNYNKTEYLIKVEKNMINDNVKCDEVTIKQDQYLCQSIKTNKQTPLRNGWRNSLFYSASKKFFPILKKVPT